MSTEWYGIFVQAGKAVAALKTLDSVVVPPVDVVEIDMSRYLPSGCYGASRW